MKNQLPIIILSCLVLACAEKKQTILVENKTDTSVAFKEVWIKKEQLASRDGYLPLIRSSAERAVPTQMVDLDSDGSWDKLVFQVSINANSSLQLMVDWVPSDDYPAFEKQAQVFLGYGENQSGDYMPLDQSVRPKGLEPEDQPYTYQFEGPGWENNKIGFRSYFDTRNGKDIFGKVTDDMVLSEVALGENYHELQPWGMDVLKVGSSLGAGALAILKEDSLIRLGPTDYAEFQKVVDGPLYAQFRLVYKGWDVLGETYELQEDITIWANKQWYQSEVVLPGNTADTLVTGIVNLKDAAVDQFSALDHEVLMTHGVQSENKDALGMALLIPAANSAGFANAPTDGDGIVSSELAYLKSTGEAYTFRFYTGWEASDNRFAAVDYLRSELSKAVQEWNVLLDITIQ